MCRRRKVSQSTTPTLLPEYLFTVQLLSHALWCSAVRQYSSSAMSTAAAPGSASPQAAVLRRAEAAEVRSTAAARLWAYLCYLFALVVRAPVHAFDCHAGARAKNAMVNGHLMHAALRNAKTHRVHGTRVRMKSTTCSQLPASWCIQHYEWQGQQQHAA
jgi:hypothetical protein